MDAALKSTAVLLPTTALLAHLVNTRVPKPYLDEIFHIPQAEQYCRGDFRTWDPSITTPPGLYILSTSLAWLTGHACSPGFLRLTNVLLGTTVIPASIAAIVKKPTTAKILAISTFPLITFFSLLYYTDVGSLAFVLLSYAAAHKRRYGLSATAGLVSLLFRQTNVVWVAFIAATSILSAYDDDTRPHHDQSKPLLGIASPAELLSELIRTPWTIISSPRKALGIIGWFIPTFVGFTAFVIYNGGIVLGHQEMHVATLHFPQLLYFVGFATGMGWPVLLNEGVGAVVSGAMRTGMGSVRRICVSLVVLMIMNIMVSKYTIEHPFLLADNRHYFFYIWRRIFKFHPYVKYLLTPGYLGAGWAWMWKIGRTHGVYWMIGFLACTALVLVPTPLVEPRYFLIPYILLRLHCPTPQGRVCGKWLAVEIGWNTIVNVVTIGVFLTVTFKWEGWEGPMRFMW